jgi:hypothetical protein
MLGSLLSVRNGLQRVSKMLFEGIKKLLFDKIFILREEIDELSVQTSSLSQLATLVIFNIPNKDVFLNRLQYKLLT